MPGLLIGINPPKDLRNEIYKLKKQVVNSCGNQQQVNEPPHCTFVVNEFSDVNNIDQVLKNLSNKYSSIPIKISGMKCFPPDKSSGLWVVYASIEKSKHLQKLQEDVVKQTAKYRVGCTLCDYFEKNMPGYQYSEEENINIKKYGFPYISNNWVPHITVAFLDDDAYSKIGKQLLLKKFRYNFDLREITLYTYENKWVPYKSYKLNGEFQSKT